MNICIANEGLLCIIKYRKNRRFFFSIFLLFAILFTVYYSRCLTVYRIKVMDGMLKISI